MNEEQEARLYNKAFLHGKEVGLKFGREIALDKVLEIIEKAIDENCNHIGVVQNNDMDMAYSIIWERVTALKGGKQE